MKQKTRTTLTLVMSALMGIAPTTMAAQMATLIKGGTDVNDGELAFIVDFEAQFKGEEAWQHACGGSLIAPDVVITAAHCLVSPEDGLPHEKVQDYRLVFQRTDRSLPANVVMSSAMLSTVLHPTRDVALLLLSRPVENAVTVELPELSITPTPGSLATVAGWGYTEDDAIPERMRQVEVPIVASDSCNSPYPDARYTVAKAFPRLCAGAPGKGAAPGDSGGPLFRLESKSGKYVILGTVSGGRPGYPDGYVNLADPELWDGFPFREARKPNK